MEIFLKKELFLKNVVICFKVKMYSNKNCIMKSRFTYFALIFFSVLYAQQEAQFTQYMHNTFNFNPAYTGSRGAMNIFILHRAQWIGLEGAPETNTVSISSPIEGTNLGVGLSIINDKIGISNQNSIAAAISYSIKTSKKYKLSFGLQCTAQLLSVDFSRLTLRNPSDYAISQQSSLDNSFSPNIGAGIYFYSDKMYFGLSIPQLLDAKYYNDNASTVYSEQKHSFFMAGRVFDLNENIKFKPAILSKIVPGAPMQLDVSGNFLIYDKITFGAAYRWNVAMSGLAGFQINNSWYIGYAYDLETNKLAHYNSGSHEIFLRFEVFKNYNKIISPRFF